MGWRDNRKYENQGRDQINIEQVNGNLLLKSQAAVRPDAERDLLEAVRRWVELRLEGQLHHAVKLNLQKEAQPQQVHPWGMEMKVAIAQSSQRLPPETTMGQVFDQCSGRLLILGEPGAGKTTSLLDLALELVERAEDDPQQRIPVVIDLSDWQPTVSRSISRRSGIFKKNFPDSSSEQVPVWPIANWLTGKVREKYGVPLKQIKQWLEEKRLIPLLDGLDEVSPENQKDCVRSINLWLNSDMRPRQVAVCCRREPYETYAEKLELDGAVYLNDLTDEQIQTFLVEANRDELRESLVADKNLLALIRRPLLLSMAIIAYKELEPIQWQRESSAGDRLNLLLDAYVRHMLTQDTLSHAYRNRKPPSQEQSRKWLEFLALELLQDSETDFLIERIHTTWLPTLLQKSLFTILAIAVWGIVFAVCCWGLISTINFWVQFFRFINPIRIGSSSRLWLGFGIGSLYGLVRGVQVLKDLPYIESVKRAIRNPLSDLKPEKVLRKLSSWKATLIPPQVSNLIYKLVELPEANWGFNLEEWIFSVKTLSVPNQGIKNLLRNAILITLIFVPLHTLMVCIARHSASYLDRIIVISLCMAFLMWTIWGGGNVCINHFLVRLCLYGTRSIPWDYARFLNYATERLLLQRTGSSYRFMHDLLRQSLAQSRINSYPHLISSQVFFRCGRSYFSMGQYDKALQDFSRAIKLDPKYDWAIAERGVTYMFMERYEEALQDLNRAIELNPKYDRAIAWRGVTYRFMERYEEALQDFNRAIELNPRYGWAIAERGVTYRFMERYEEALQDFNRAIEIEPKADWRLYLRALNYFVHNQADSAKADLNKAIQMAQQEQAEKPDNYQNTFNLAIYHLIAGNLSTAQEFYQSALQQSASPTMIRGAIRDLKELLRIFPENTAAQQIKVTLEEEIGEIRFR